MSNEEINILINLHIEALESGREETDIQKQRLIKALKEIVKDEPR